MAEIQLPSLPILAARPNRTQKLLAKLLEGRYTERSNVAEKDRPLELLDLPLDILQTIVKEVTHTNDLTSLALAHSTLHSLAIPHIYSRFDIVWPEANPTVESRLGVDALTYGLATLVMAHDVFGEAPYQQVCANCEHCQEHKPRLQPRNVPVRVRRGNYFAQHTRKFSLGNGPADWVTEYLITKEGGKMLGTLVALALGRMRNLEAFIWDMPTGVLRDVWLALASLGNRNDGKECRLEKVWVRWHDNRDAVPLSPPQPNGTAIHQTNLPYLLQGTATSIFQIPPYPTVEFPTFSILPPLKSISVLDIDEIPYAEELSILLDRSIDVLQELRVGVAVHAQRDLPFRPIEDRSTIPPAFPTAHEFCRPGGLLGILVSRFLPLFGIPPAASNPTLLVNASDTTSVTLADISEGLRSPVPMKDVETLDDVEGSDMNQLGALLSAQSLHDEEIETNYHEFTTPTASFPKELDQSRYGFGHSSKDQPKKLRLSILELERIYLSIPVLSRSIDWSRLESLTLLGCMNHEQLWKALRRTFTPTSSRSRSSMLKLGSTGKQRSSSLSSMVDTAEYKLGIRRIHTNTVSKALLSFIRDTLAPDTLEWLFLQETSTYKSSVKIDEIYKAVRRHKGSLRKLLVDSEIHAPNHRDRDREREPVDTNWRRWTCSEDLITLITSERMHLRELSLCVDYKHWHYFLQRLPYATSLRSLHISHIAEHPYGRSFDPREVALQVLDIISLRSEIELCYLGVERKCFEILECSPTEDRCSMPNPTQIGLVTHDENAELSNSHVDEDDEDDDQDDGGVHQHANPNQYDHAISSDDSDGWEVNSNVTSHVDDEDEDDEAQDSEYDRQRKKPTFRLREILFYDDKISIFKARHGKL